MANHESSKESSGLALDKSHLPPPMAYVPIVKPYPGTIHPGPHFLMDRTSPSFLTDRVSSAQIYRLWESEKLHRLSWYYYEFSTGNHIKILIKGEDWTTARSILRREYRNNDLWPADEFSRILGSTQGKSRPEDNDILHYCQLFALISRGLVLRTKLDLYICTRNVNWFYNLQGLPERVVVEISYRFDIDLEDDDGLDFGDLLEKALVLVKRRRYLVNLIRDKETDPVNEYTEPQEKVPTAPDIIELLPYLA